MRVTPVDAGLRADGSLGRNAHGSTDVATADGMMNFTPLARRGFEIDNNSRS
jgi:hypothetical protein